MTENNLTKGARCVIVYMDKRKAPDRAAATAPRELPTHIIVVHTYDSRLPKICQRGLVTFKKEDKPMRFYVNRIAQPNGDHEVHRATCSWLPNVENRIYLGDFATSQAAVREARKYFAKVNGCYYCCPESHTT